MKSINRFQLIVLGVFSSALIISSTSAYPCHFCYSVSSWTLSQQVVEYDVVVLAQWHHAVRGVNAKPGTTTFEVLEVLRAPQPGAPAKGQRIDFVKYREGKNSEFFLICGKNANTFIWYSPFEISAAAYEYVKLAPSPQMPIHKRFEYFVNYLENADPQVAEDAYTEIANISFEELITLTPSIPLKKVRSWIANPKNAESKRLELYGKLLGLVGNDEDVELMKNLITDRTVLFRPGIEGIMSGYLLLTGETGLSVIDETKLHDNTVPFSESYAAIQALRFMWQHGDGLIDHDRLRESMRILLDRPELADLVITDLARWKDWESQERLASLYGSKEYDTLAIKRAIVRFLLKSMRDIPETEKDIRNAHVKLPEHVIRGEQLLEEIRKKDPITVAQVEKNFFWLKSP